MKTGNLKKSLLRNFSGTFLIVTPIAVLNAAACGTGSSTITNFPPQDQGGYQPYVLNATGQVTGFFYSSAHTLHAFIYTAGAITDLGTLGGPTSIGYAMNSSGQVAGQADLASGSHAFLYSGGSLMDLGTLGGSSSSASALNESGLVAGNSLIAGDVGPVAFLYTNGTMLNLGTLGSNYSSAFALNNNGMVVGESGVASGDIHGFVYSGGQIADVGTLGGTYSSAFALNDSGVVVGESSLTTGDTHGFVYFGGTMIDLGTFGGTYSTAFAVNTNSQVAGVANTANDAETHGFLYDHGTMTDLGTLGGNYSSVWTMNNRGQIVGDSALADNTIHAFLWDKGQLVDLNTLLPANSGWEVISAQLINDAGRIVGYGLYGGSYQWFVMDLASGNNAPVAVAGPNQTVDCQAQVTLDGSASSDPDNDPLTFAWSLGNAVLGTNVTLTTSLPLGTNVVTLTVTDTCGATGQTNVTVIVSDTTPPTVTCPPNMTAASDANCSAAVPNIAAQVVASDNCTPQASLQVTQDPAAGTLVGLGPHAIAINVTDSSGNSSSCSVLFTVFDKIPPTIVTVPGPQTVSAGANCQGVVPNVLANVVASDNCTPANQLHLSQNPAAGTMLGTGQYTILVTATDASGNSSTANVVLNINDTTPPAILSVPSPLTVSVGANCQGVVPNVLSGVVASDNCTPPNQLVLTQNPAAGTVLPKGSYIIVVTATDLAGNSASTKVTLLVADTTPPVIQSLTASPNVLSSPNHQIVPIAISAVVSDNCDSAPVSSIVSVTCNETLAPGDVQITGNLTLNLAATRDPSGNGRIYTITVQSTDVSGNSSTATVTVVVPKGNGNGNGNGNHVGTK